MKALLYFIKKYVTSKTIPENKLPKTVTYHSYHESNIAKFNNYLDPTNWNVVLDHENANDAYEVFLKLHQEALDKCIHVPH